MTCPAKRMLNHFISYCQLLSAPYVLLPRRSTLLFVKIVPPEQRMDFGADEIRKFVEVENSASLLRHFVKVMGYL